MYLTMKKYVNDNKTPALNTFSNDATGEPITKELYDDILNLDFDGTSVGHPGEPVRFGHNIL